MLLNLNSLIENPFPDFSKYDINYKYFKNPQLSTLLFDMYEESLFHTVEESVNVFQQLHDIKYAEFE